MKQTKLRHTAIVTITLAALAAVGSLAVLAAVGRLALRRHGATAAPTQSASAMLAALPAATGGSLSDQAIAHLADLVRKEPKISNVWAALGDALMQKARETADASYYTRAEKAYQQALTLNPKTLGAVIGMAWVNGGRHEFEQSILWADKALAIDPKNNDAYGLIGDAQIEMGDNKAAEESYQKMIDIRPDLSSYGRGAHLMWLRGDVRNGIMLMVRAVKAGSPFAENTAWCRAQLGLMLFSMGALPAADNTLKAALKLAPNNYQALAAMGKIKAAEKNYPAAIDFYKRSIAVVPTIDAVATLGDLYRLTGDTTNAETQYALVETIQHLLKANGVRGDMLIDRFYADHDRNLPEALSEIRAEYATRKNVYAEDTLAWCCFKNGRYEEAREIIDQVLNRHAPEALFRFHAGMIYARLGDRPSSETYLYQALSENPNFSPVYSQVAVDTLSTLGSRPPSSDTGIVKTTPAAAKTR